MNATQVSNDPKAKTDLIDRLNHMEWRSDQQGNKISIAVPVEDMERLSAQAAEHLGVDSFSNNSNGGYTMGIHKANVWDLMQQGLKFPDKVAIEQRRQAHGSSRRGFIPVGKPAPRVTWRTAENGNVVSGALSQEMAEGTLMLLADASLSFIVKPSPSNEAAVVIEIPASDIAKKKDIATAGALLADGPEIKVGLGGILGVEAGRPR